MAHMFFVVYYDAASSLFVDDVVEQLTQAIAGDRGIITAPEGVIIEQFTVGDSEREEWE